MLLDLTTRPFVPKRHGEEPFRCSGCSRIVATDERDAGRINMRCRSCKAFRQWTGTGKSERITSSSALRRMDCDSCGHVVCRVSSGFSGSVYLRCLSCNANNAVFAVPHPPVPSDPDEFMAMMEERWERVVARLARRRAEVAVGLRFDVFKRDEFRCRYCGSSVDDGAILHADHVIPISKGGPTTMENLVTACAPCNRGKSNKPLTSDG